MLQAALAKEVLAEVPRQVLEYMKANKIAPRPRPEYPAHSTEQLARELELASINPTFAPQQQPPAAAPSLYPNVGGSAPPYPLASAPPPDF